MLTVGVGQCGVQVSSEFWRLAKGEAEVVPSSGSLPPLVSTAPDKISHVSMESEPVGPVRHAPTRNALFDGGGYARAVLVDSEPKVVQQVIDVGSPKYLSCVDVTSCLCEESGRGNVWSWGYNLPPRQHKLSNEIPLWARAMSTVRRKMESSDGALPIVLMHSIGGGTGSGLGSRLGALLKEEYPRTPLLSVIVAPFTMGDTPLQHYNALFSLAYAQEHSDGILYFSNDDLMQRTKLAKAGGIIKHAESQRVSTDDMNAVLSQTLLQTLYPSQSLAAKRSDVVSGGDTSGLPRLTPSRVAARSAFDVPSLIDSLVTAPSMKFIDVRCSNVRLLSKAKPSGRRPATSAVKREGGVSVSDLLKGLDIDDDVDDDARVVDVGASTAAGARSGSMSSGAKGVRVGQPTLAQIAKGSSRSIVKVTPSVPAPRASSSASGVGTRSKRDSSVGATVRTTRAVASASLSVTDWETLAAHTVANLPRRRANGKRVKLYVAKLYARGVESSDMTVPRSTVDGEGGESDGSIAALWPGMPASPHWSTVGRIIGEACNIQPPKTKHGYQLGFEAYGGSGFQVTGQRKSLSLCTNSDAINDSLLNILNRSSEMFETRAYVHWYTRYGCEESDFTDAFYKLSSVVRSYADAGMEA